MQFFSNPKTFEHRGPYDPLTLYLKQDYPLVFLRDELMTEVKASENTPESELLMRIVNTILERKKTISFTPEEKTLLCNPESAFMRIMRKEHKHAGGPYHYFFTPPKHWHNPNPKDFITTKYIERFTTFTSTGRPVAPLPPPLPEWTEEDNKDEHHSMFGREHS